MGTVEITQAEFNQRVHFHGNPYHHSERAWFRHGAVYGAVVFDKVDKDWSFVALTPDKTGLYRCADLGIDFKDADLAADALASAMTALHDIPGGFDHGD